MLYTLLVFLALPIIAPIIAHFFLAVLGLVVAIVTYPAHCRNKNKGN